jgi:hypothetical protein
VTQDRRSTSIVRHSPERPVEETSRRDGAREKIEARLWNSAEFVKESFFFFAFAESSRRFFHVIDHTEWRSVYMYDIVLTYTRLLLLLQ